MCGQHYQNHIADQFDLIADKDELSRRSTRGEVFHEVTVKIGSARKIGEASRAAIDKVQAVMEIHKQEHFTAYAVAAEGRNEAQRYLQERLAELDAEHGSKQRQLEECESRMKVDSRRAMRGSW
ncbi:MAG: hypothetical protein R3D52_11365 [Xanthobacteraceae bacterium]